MTEEPRADARATDEVMAGRLAKIGELRDKGIEPFRDGFERTASVGDVMSRYSGLGAGEETDDTVTVAGRIVAKRDQGKALFLVIRDGAAEIQIFCRLDVLGGEGFSFARDLDPGDWIGVTGRVLRTRRGELSISPGEVVLLSKSIRPLPEKYHGLADTETRYRQRYVDLIANPEVRAVFETRFRIIAAIRRFMDARGFIEVETPMLQPIPGGATRPSRS